jgi:methionyl-tRNA synthetase
LYVLCDVIRILGILVQPFMPKSAAKLLDQLGLAETHRSFDDITRSPVKAGTAIPEPKGIFPRLEDK